MSLPFELAPVQVGGKTPVWNGDRFQIGDELTKILQYSLNDAGWNDDLTSFHEETAGDHHFIDKASRDYTLNQLKNNLKSPHPTILEVGCSSGFMLKRIFNAFPNATVMGSDIVSEPLKKLAEVLPSVPLFRFDLVKCPLPDNCIDAVVMLNVLEHIEDDQTALRQIYRILKPGGILVLELPAGPNLYDIYDKVLMHYRRYNMTPLCNSLKSENFSILKKSHLGFFLYPAFWVVKKLNRRLLTASEPIQKQYIEKSIKNTGRSKLMHSLMRLELFLGNIISYPFGIRCLVTCKK